MLAVETLRPTGALTVFSAHVLLPQGIRLIRQGDLMVDFADVTECDSAALAMLFDWQRHANAAGHRLQVRNLPASLHSLADLYGVTDLLPAAV